MRFSIQVVGLVAIIVGAIWLGQGTGIFPYPSTSFMIDQSRWAYIGGALLVIGVLLVAAGRGAHKDP